MQNQAAAAADSLPALEAAPSTDSPRRYKVSPCSSPGAYGFDVVCNYVGATGTMVEHAMCNCTNENDAWTIRNALEKAGA